MKEDIIITIEDNRKYLLLLESEITDESYFLSVLLDENNEPTEEYAILKKVVINGEEYSQKINNPLILNELIADYREQYQDLYEN